LKGDYAGETYEGIWGQKKHFDAGGGYIGETWEGMVGEDSDFQDDCRLSNVLDTDDFVEGNGW